MTAVLTSGRKLIFIGEIKWRDRADPSLQFLLCSGHLSSIILRVAEYSLLCSRYK